MPLFHIQHIFFNCLQMEKEKVITMARFLSYTCEEFLNFCPGQYKQFLVEVRAVLK